MLRSRQFFIRDDWVFCHVKPDILTKELKQADVFGFAIGCAWHAECLLTWGLAGCVHGGGMIPDSTGPDRMGTRERALEATQLFMHMFSHDLVYLLLLAFCNKFLIWFEFPQLQEMLKMNFLFQVSAMLGSFNITSHETWYYITAVIVPGILSTDLL